jgi:tryptophan-rich sensory protein
MATQTARVSNNPTDLHPILSIIGSVVAIALLGGLATDTSSAWYLNLRKPSWQPPAWLFGPVWTTIYALLAASAIIVWRKTRGETGKAIMILYAINGAFNLAWSWIFFRGHSAFWGGFDILAVWITIILLMIRAWPVSRAASMLLLPYLLWVTFASVLNWAIVTIN